MTHYFIELDKICSFMGVDKTEARYAAQRNMYVSRSKNGSPQVDVISFYKWATKKPGRATARRSFVDIAEKYLKTVTRAEQHIKGQSESRKAKVEIR